MVSEFKKIINYIKVVVLLITIKLRLISSDRKQKLEHEMAKKKQQSETLEQTENANTSDVTDTLNQLEQAAILNELALGIARTERGWSVVQIAFNAETGESDVQDVQLAGTSREDAIDLFKIKAVQKGIV